MQWNAFGDKKLMIKVIHATMRKGKFKDEEVLIARIRMIPTDMPFEFKRIQFPIRVAFAMTINKSQGQSLWSKYRKLMFFSWSILCVMFT